MRLHSDLELKIYSWLISFVTDIGLTDVIFEYQNGVTPDTDHIVVSIVSSSIDSPPEIRYKDSVGLEREEYTIYRSNVDIVLRVMSNTGAMAQAEELKARIWGSASTQEMTKQNIGFVSLGSTSNTSALSGPKFEQRADINMILSYTKTYEKTSTNEQGTGGDTIGEVQVIGKDQNNTIIIDKVILDS